MTLNSGVRYQADAAFSQARRRAFFRRLWRLLTGQQEQGLLSFEEVRHKLKIRGQHYAGIQTIAIEKIAGSVGRYQEFNRAFLPQQEHIRERWKQVYLAAHAAGFPPIDVYKIGDVYFVRDGHHRVSVLKELGATTVEASVTELETAISLSADVGEQDMDLKVEYAWFLEETGLDELLGGELDLEFTLPGQYPKLLEHIAVHRHFLGLREMREIGYSEAVARWYHEVYTPLVQVIREDAILESFPGRTEADLYLWVIEHRQYLAERENHEVPLEEAAISFSREFSNESGKKQLLAGARRSRSSQARKAKPVTVSVFGSGSAPPGHEVLDLAERLGRLLAEAGFDVMCGGYAGTMEAVSRGAAQAGGEVIGVTMDLFSPGRVPNPWLTREQRVKDFFPRLKRLMGADAFVVMRGGIGTLTEATLAWSLLQTGQISARPFIFIGENWRRLFSAFEAETFVSEADFDLTMVVDSPDEAVMALKEALAPTP